jgi:hypothetical protein
MILADWADGSTDSRGNPLTGSSPQTPERVLKTRADAEKLLPTITEKIVRFNERYTHCTLVNVRIVTNRESGCFTAKCYR